MQLLVLEALEAEVPFAPYVSATLRTIGHDVTTCSTLAGLVEALMRNGARFDVVVLNTTRDELLSDAARYAHWYAPGAELVALGGRQSQGPALPFPIATVLDLTAATAAKLPAL